MRSKILAGLFAAGLIACGAVFGQSEQAQAAQDAAQIFACQMQGREAGSYKSYHDCMVDAGLHEGGSR
jgi:hypothetical protein